MLWSFLFCCYYHIEFIFYSGLCFFVLCLLFVLFPSTHTPSLLKYVCITIMQLSKSCLSLNWAALSIPSIYFDIIWMNSSYFSHLIQYLCFSLETVIWMVDVEFKLFFYIWGHEDREWMGRSWMKLRPILAEAQSSVLFFEIILNVLNWSQLS